MPSKTELASRFVSSLGLTPVLGALRSAFRNDFLVLAYHRVLPELNEAAYAFDTELVSALQADFDWQMAYVARHFQPVSCQQVADAFRSGVRLPKRAMMVTFDDGFSDNHEVAFPVLRRHGVPALFLLSTNYIGTQRIFWFDWLVHVLLRTSARQIRLDALGLTIDLGATAAARRVEALKLLHLLKRTPESRRLQSLQQLDQAAAVDLTDADRAQSAPMTWDQVREMSIAGMEIGSHTASHPILSTITDPALLRFELEESKAILERETGRPVIALAYPVGGRDAVNAEVLAATAQAGYQIAFTYEPGGNRLPSHERFMLKRIHVERYMTRAMFAAAVEMPEIFGR